MMTILQPPPTPPPPPRSLWTDSASGLPAVFPLTVRTPEKNEGSGTRGAESQGGIKPSLEARSVHFLCYTSGVMPPLNHPAARGPDRTGTRVGLKQRAQLRLPNVNLGPPPHGGFMGGRAPQVPTGARPSQPPSTSTDVPSVPCSSAGRTTLVNALLQPLLPSHPACYCPCV